MKINKFNTFLNEDKDLFKTLLLEVLNKSYINLVNQIPQTKKIKKSISIIDVNPIELVDFMKSNNIPDTAYFSGRDNGYDAWDDIILEWEIDVPTTDKDKLNFSKKRFSDIVFPNLYKELTNNGFKRKSVDSSLFKQYDDTTIYDMFINKDIDRLIKYYSMYFTIQ